MPTEHTQALIDRGIIPGTKPIPRRPRGTSEKTVSKATVNAMSKIHALLLPLDSEQRSRVLSAVNALLGEAD